MPGIDELLAKIEGAEFKKKLENLATNCQEKLGIPYNAVLEYFEKEVKSLSKRMPGAKEETIHRQAWIRTKGHYQPELMSPAVSFFGMIIGIGDKFDMVGKARREALEAWNQDKEKSVKDGICDAEGKPLDIRQEFGSGKVNPSFGKPLPDHAWIRNIRGVAKQEGGEIKRFTMPLSEERVDIDLPSMVPLSFRANIREEKDGEFELNQWSRIAFNKIKSDDPDFQNVESILIKHFKDYLCDCANLLEYHQKVAGDYQRFVLLNVDVDHIGEPNPSNRNQMMIISDMSLEEGGVTVWIPPHLQPPIFDSGSSIILGGSTSETEFQGERRAMVNVQSIYSDPECRVTPMPKSETKVS